MNIDYTIFSNKLFSMKKRLCVLLLFLVVSIIGTAQDDTPGIMYSSINQYQADVFMLDKKYTIKYTPEYINRMNRFYTEKLELLKQLPFNKFSQHDKVDYILLKNVIEKDKEQHAVFSDLYNQLAIAFSCNRIILDFEAKRRVGGRPGTHMEDDFIALKREIEATKKRVIGTPNYTSTQYGFIEAGIMNLRKAFQECYDFYNGYDPLFTKQVRAAYAMADSSLGEYATTLNRLKKETLEKKDTSGISGNAIGYNGLVNGFKHEKIPYTPQQVEMIALKEFEWCEAEMIKASQEMGYGQDWKQALEKVKNNYVEMGKQPEQTKFLADEAISFIESKNLITIPAEAKEGWYMKMLSPEQQKFAPFFLGGERVLIAYPHESMDSASKLMSLRGNNSHFSRAVVFHELIPGHNLQYFMSERFNSYRRPFGTSFWTEGWALYWEMLLYDLGFAPKPEDRVGMLFWRMHRCARIIFSINFHTGKWTPGQCIDFLVDKVGHERANAVAEVRRSLAGNYGPLYQISYMLGGLQFRALHKEFVQSGKMTNKAFHDKIMKEGSMPVEMVRAILSNTKLSPNFSTSWKFAGDIQ